MGKVIPNAQLFLLLIFLSLFLIVLDNFKILNLPKKWSYYLTNPVSFGIYRTNQFFKRQFYFVFSSRSAAQENKALKEQVGQLLSENAGLRRKLSEVDSLLEQNQSLDPKTYNLISARPIGITRFLKIDKGLSSGLKLGEVVVFKDNYIGRIVKISEGSSDIQMITDPESKIAAFSQNTEGKARGVVTGVFGTESVMDKILHEEAIKEGDLVYSEGTEGFLPRGLVIGRVLEVIDNKSLPVKQARLKPVFDIRDLELVFIIQE